MPNSNGYLIASLSQNEFKKKSAKKKMDKNLDSFYFNSWIDKIKLL